MIKIGQAENVCTLEADGLGNLGLAYRPLGDVRQAIKFHEQHLAIEREIGNRRGEGNALGNLLGRAVRKGDTWLRS